MISPSCKISLTFREIRCNSRSCVVSKEASCSCGFPPQITYPTCDSISLLADKEGVKGGLSFCFKRYRPSLLSLLSLSLSHIECDRKDIEMKQLEFELYYVGTKKFQKRCLGTRGHQKIFRGASHSLALTSTDRRNFTQERKSGSAQLAHSCNCCLQIGSDFFWGGKKYMTPPPKKNEHLCTI